jgi:predicted negative regulator of RcsB-dependent stress response
LLEQSAAAYRSVLTMAPGHPGTTHNLALVLGQLGKTDELKALLASTKPGSTALTSTIATALGDAQARQDDLPGAYQTFAQAAGSTDDPAIKRKLIQVAMALPAVPNDMPGLVRSWEVRTPAIAAEAYAVMFRKKLAAGDSNAADSLVRWVRLRADGQSLSSDDVQATFGDIKDRSVQQLVGFLLLLEKGSNDAFQDSKVAADFAEEWKQQKPIIRKFPWWAGTRESRDALAMAALAIGRASENAGRSVNAQYQFLCGMQVAPQIDAYFGAALDRLTPLDLITELVWLQVQHPKALDPSGRKVNKFIGIMFEGKGGAYEAHDLIAIQRHHSVLGPIFAERKQWLRGKANFDNAIFQLKSAIRFAGQREKETGFHQALPGLKAMLADGYRAVAQAENERKARVDAAEAALDSDDLRGAETQLKALAETSPDEATGGVARQLSDILEARQAVAGKDPAAEPAWATTSKVEGINSDFLRRQQFKFLADLAASPEVENRDRLLETAWAIAGELPTLIGMEDVLRLERMRAARAGADQPDADRMKIVPGGPKPQRQAGEWLLSLPSSDLPFIASLPQ